VESCRVEDVDLHYVEHGSGVPVVVLHGAGVDHREPEACFEPVLEPYGGLHRIYPDLPGMGRTAAPETVRSADDVLRLLLRFLDEVAEAPALLVGHSAGAYYAQAMAAVQPGRVAGLALVCPLLAGIPEVPGRRVVVGTGDLGDDAFRSYFVVQTEEMLDRYTRYVAPGAALADHRALERIGAAWELAAADPGALYPAPTLLVAGRLDSTVGYAAAADLLPRYPAGTLAVLDAAGHALPHEQPRLLGALVEDWLDRCRRGVGRGIPVRAAGGS
jgi:pimeloyl-ACP methyl ester carboxylesterase